MRKGSRTGIHEEGLKSKGKVRSELSRLRDVLPVLLEPAVNLAQAVFEPHLGFVLEDLAGLVDRGQEAMLLVPVPALLERDACLVSRQFVHPLGQICNADLAARGQINGFPDGLVVLGARDQAADDVIDIREVSGLIARTRYREGLSVDSPVEEIGNDVAIFPWDFPRPV